MKTLETKTEISATTIVARTVTITLFVMALIAGAANDIQATIHYLAQ